jgi:DNA repair photolyase
MAGWPEIRSMSLQIIEKINAAGLPCDVLTKGILPETLAEKRFRKENRYGISIVSLDEGFRRRFEPGAAPYADRIKALRHLHDRGYSTYAHIEPYPTPNIVKQDIETLLQAIVFVDSLYFGAWNYSTLAGKDPDHPAFYAQQERKVRAFCRKHRIACEM